MVCHRFTTDTSLCEGERVIGSSIYNYLRMFGTVHLNGNVQNISEEYEKLTNRPKLPEERETPPCYGNVKRRTETDAGALYRTGESVNPSPLFTFNNRRSS